MNEIGSSTTLGQDAKAEGEGTAVGFRANANKNSVAVGMKAVANTSNSVAIGIGAHTDGTDAVAIGHGADATTGGVAIGGYPDVPGRSRADERGCAVGTAADAKKDAIALGFGAKAEGNGAIAIGFGARAQGNGAIAIGSTVTATEENEVRLGLMDNRYVLPGLGSQNPKCGEHKWIVVVDKEGNLDRLQLGSLKELAKALGLDE